MDTEIQCPFFLFNRRLLPPLRRHHRLRFESYLQSAYRTNPVPTIYVLQDIRIRRKSSWVFLLFHLSRAACVFTSKKLQKN